MTRVDFGERQLKIEGVAVDYMEAGDGYPVVLLHGTGDGAAVWKWVLPGLARSHRVLAPTLPGFDGRPRRGADYSPRFFSRFVESLLDALRLERAVLVGNSLGGLVASHVALAQPARVRALVLVSSAGLGRELNPLLTLAALPGVGELTSMLARTQVGAAQRAYARAALLFARPSRAPREWLDDQRRIAQRGTALRATVASLRRTTAPWGQRELVVDELAELDLPILLVWGRRDRVIPVRQAQAAVERLPSGSLAVIDDAGHVPQVEQPARFVGEVSAFLDRAATLAAGGVAEHVASN